MLVRSTTLTHSHHSPSSARVTCGYTARSCRRRCIFLTQRRLPYSARCGCAARSAATSSPAVTSLSIATVNRQVIALLDAGLLRERADLAVSGAIGRPRVPVEINHEPFVTLGIHVGARTTSIVATDLFGRTLDTVETPTPLSSGRARAGVAGRKREPVPAALASAPAALGRSRDRWRRRQRHWPRRPPQAGLAPSARRAGVGRRSEPAGVGGFARRRHGRGRVAAWHAAIRADLTDQPVRLRSRDRGLRAGDRRTGALPVQRPGHHRGSARVLRAARRHRAAGVHGQRRGGAGRCAQAADPARRPAGPRRTAPRPASPTCCG